MKNGKKPKQERWPLSRLKDHPRQAEIFVDLPEAEFAAFVADVEKNGIRVPPEILPSGVVILGHQRVRAARQLGWTEIDVVVRYDLADAEPAVVEELFVNDNLLRRHLSPLSKARCLRRLLELRQGERAGRINGLNLETLKKDIGAQLNLSDRSVNRYLLILDAPSCVQAAFDRGELPLTTAGRVALLYKADQDKIARRIDAGENAKKVVTSSLRGDPKSEARQAFLRLLRAFSREAPKLEGRIALVPAFTLDLNRPHLREARRLIDELLGPET
jgi:ParB family transcriptional regulator, chromosome partitioning protein